MDSTSEPSRTFSPGDKVTFSHASRRGSTVTVKTKTGVVKELLPDGSITILHGRRQLASPNPRSVRHAGQQSALGAGFDALVKALAADSTSFP